MLSGPALWAQQAGQPLAAAPSPDAAQLRQEIDQLKKTIAAMEQRLAAQEEAARPRAAKPEASKDTVSSTDLQASVRDLGDRVSATERKTLTDRLQWSGDYRFEGHTIRASVPAHLDGMQMQNLLVKTLFLFTPASQGGLGMAFNPAMLQGMAPQDFSTFVNQQVNGRDGTGVVVAPGNYAQYQLFTSNLTFNQLKQGLGQFPASAQQGLMQLLGQAPGVFVPGYKANNDILYTNRLRLRFESQVAENVSFGARLSMYKVFGDSTGVQVFNGQPNTFNIDGTTTGVPTGDMLRVERAYFNWNKIGGSKFYFSIGRRPSTDGPPLNFRNDELRGGTPTGALFNFQYDGMTFGYRATDKMTLRVCYGMGYQSGFGNGNLLKTPADRLKDVHLVGGLVDLWETDKTFVQALVARAWNVTDGFNGLMVLPNNPLTGDAVAAPVIMRYTPSANLGGINLYGLTAQRRFGPVDVFVSGNWVGLRPNGLTSPFGGLGADPFDTPVDHNGHMIYAGLRFNVPQNDGNTKLGFEFNQGSKYWFNFAHAEDDIIAPKTQTRGEVYETYVTHRINDHFIFKADFIRYHYTWSGSGWHMGAPKALDQVPLLGFPTYDNANMFTFGLTARF
jgi:hypothetical protein